MSSSYDSAVVDTAMIEDARLLILPRGVRLLYFEALVWAKLRRTDGLIPRAALPRMTDEPDSADAADRLVQVGPWEAVPGGWQIVNFTLTQMSAVRVEAQQRAAAERYDRWRSEHPDHPRGKRNGVANGKSNANGNGPARPPSRPQGWRVEEAAGTPPEPPLRVDRRLCRRRFSVRSASSTSWTGTIITMRTAQPQERWRYDPPNRPSEQCRPVRDDAEISATRALPPKFALSSASEPLTARGLARLLEPYRVVPLRRRVDGHNLRGYFTADFFDAWQRHLTGEPKQAAHPEQAPPSSDETLPFVGDGVGVTQ